MTRIPSYQSKEVVRKVIKAGYVLKRHGKGSHDIYYNSGKRPILPDFAKILRISASITNMRVLRAERLHQNGLPQLYLENYQSLPYFLEGVL